MSSLFGIRKLKEDLVEAIKSSAARVLAKKKPVSICNFAGQSSYETEHLHSFFSRWFYNVYVYVILPVTCQSHLFTSPTPIYNK